MNLNLQFNIRLLVLLAGLSLLNSLPLAAQTWQWGKRGGGIFDNGSVTPKEAVVDMATDKNGNVYILAIAIHSGSPADIDGNTLGTYGDRDIVISKFNCNGVFKWSKVIGGGNTDFPTAIGTDTLGHVYVSGKTYDNLPPNQVRFSTDTTQQPGNEKSLFLIQYDTLGTFKWLRQPNPDTATHINTYTCESYDMKVMANGDVYWLVKLHQGLISGGNGWAVTGRRPYVLQYNATGNLVNHVDLQMETDVAAFYNVNLERTRSGKFVISGGQDYYAGISNFTMGGQAITHSLFVGMFSTTGQLLWKKENAMTVKNSRVSGRPLADQTGNIYLAGTMSNNDNFNGYSHVNFLMPSIPFSSDPYLCKLDSNGTMVWMKAASGKSANYAAAVSPKGTNELWLAGDYTSAWWDSTHAFQAKPDSGTHFYVARFSTQGNLLTMDSLKGNPGSNNFFYSSVPDSKGNLYIGGEIFNTIRVGSQTLASRGGSSDFFFAKLGSPCNCTTPASSYTKSTSSRTITLTYTGTTSGVDSVVWTYGNTVSVKKTGTAISTPFTYTYPVNGTYNVCATAYSSCGSDQNCQSVTVTGVGVGTVAGLDNIKVYPNPANDYIKVEGATEGTIGHLLNLVGQDMTGALSIGNNQVISLKNLPAGTYLLVLFNKDGAKGTVRIVKQ